jgi:hypothetical protein
LSRHGKYQPGQQRPQVARCRQHQQPRGTAARQHHADAKQQPANQRPGKRALRGNLAGLVEVCHTGHVKRLGGDQRAGKHQQPDRKPGVEPAPRKADDGRAQAKPALLGCCTKQQSDRQPAKRSRLGFAQPFHCFDKRHVPHAPSTRTVCQPVCAIQRGVTLI